MRPNVKPLTHWIIYRSYRVRFRARSGDLVSGVLITPQGEIDFRYDPSALLIHLPAERIVINQHGWEIERQEAADPPGDSHDASPDDATRV